MTMTKWMTWIAASAVIAALGVSRPASTDTRIALVVKNLGTGFFEAARDGGQ